jgi:hypothetical protein
LDQVEKLMPTGVPRLHFPAHAEAAAEPNKPTHQHKTTKLNMYSGADAMPLPWWLPACTNSNKQSI